MGSGISHLKDTNDSNTSAQHGKQRKPSESTSTRGDKQPPCPLFHNYMPPGNLVPSRTLPLLMPDGATVKPQPGLSATVIALKPALVTSDDGGHGVSSSREKSPANGKTKGHALGLRGKGPPQVLENPEVSSCFLIAYDVDEMGRVAPTTMAAVTVGAGNNGASYGAGSAGASNSPSGAVGRGFNFSRNNSQITLNSPVNHDGGNAPLSVDGGGNPLCKRCPSPTDSGRLSDARSKPTPTLTLLDVTSNSSDSNRGSVSTSTVTRSAGARSSTNVNLGGSPPPPTPFLGSAPAQVSTVPDLEACRSVTHRSRSSSVTSSNAAARRLTVVQVKTDADSASGTKNPNGVVPEALEREQLQQQELERVLQRRQSRVTSPPLVNSPKSKLNGVDESTETLRSVESCLSSVKSVLVRDGKIGSCTDLSSLKNRTERRKSVATIRVTQQTRWCLFNDSKTHEAHIELALCVSQKTYLLLRSTPCVKRNSTGGTAADKRDSVNAKRLSLSTSRLPNTSECYVCVDTRPPSLQQFCELFDSDSALSEEETDQVKYLRGPVASSKAKVLHVYLVLTPGTTVGVVQGQIKGYFIDVKMVPYVAKKSLASLGPDLTLKEADKYRTAANEEAKKAGSYIHTAKYLATLAKTPDSADDVTESDQGDVVSVGSTSTRARHGAGASPLREVGAAPPPSLPLVKSPLRAPLGDAARKDSSGGQWSARRPRPEATPVVSTFPARRQQRSDSVRLSSPVADPAVEETAAQRPKPPPSLPSAGRQFLRASFRRCSSDDPQPPLAAKSPPFASDADDDAGVTAAISSTHCAASQPTAAPAQLGKNTTWRKGASDKDSSAVHAAEKKFEWRSGMTSSGSAAAVDTDSISF